MENNFVLSPYKLLLCLLVNHSKSSSSLLAYLEKYIMHSSVLSTKLEELSFKNFKIALMNDIAAGIETSKEPKDGNMRSFGGRTDQSHLNSHPLIVLFQEQKEGKISVDDIFMVLNHQLREMATLFSDDIISDGPNSKAGWDSSSSKFPIRQDRKHKDNLALSGLNSRTKGEYMPGGIIDIFIRK
jgi:hypothetical protein